MVGIQPPVGDDFHLLSRQLCNVYLGSETIQQYNDNIVKSLLVDAGVEP